MLVHICCSVDSHYFLKRLRQDCPNKEIYGFFYDPNIHPYSEYCLRLNDVKRSCDSLNIKLFEGEYDYEDWLKSVKGYENEPEQGKRCNICFDLRLDVTAKKALQLKQNTITTTLFMSPKKSFKQLEQAIKKVQDKYKVEVLIPDYRSNGGTNEQFALAKKDKLYHQDYCGCVYALSKQRQSQNKIITELMSNIGKQILPKSIESKIQIYDKINEYEKNNINFIINREKIINYRLKLGFVKINKETISSYFLFYSSTKRSFVKGKFEPKNENILRFSREEIVFLSLKYFNDLTKNTYRSVKELIFFPPKVEVEINLRQQVQSTYFSLFPIIILDNLSHFGTVEVFCDSQNYEDVIEILETV